MEDAWPLEALAFNNSCSPAMENAVELMRDHLQRRSREPSPAREEQKRTWYSVPPQLYVYDEDVINVLLNLARTHISSTFAIFADLEVDHDTRIELCLAAAAVGGLYCTAPASAKVTKMLFNDSRRLLLEEYAQSGALSFDTSLSFSKTFILLEIYGLCSGDKRASEFVEVFHASKLDAASSCFNAVPHDASADQRRQAKLLSEAVRVLDSYRVLLLQRPPSFACESQLDSNKTNKLLKLHSLSSGGLVSKLNASDFLGLPIAGMHYLATIACYSWMASQQEIENSLYSPLWNREFVELALNQWIEAKSCKKEPSNPHPASEMLLYHLTQMSLHSNLNNLQRLTQVDMQSIQRPRKGEAPEKIRAFRNSRHFNIASWHAKVILHIAQDGMAPTRRYSALEKETTRFVEAPHLPLCIYFATLIMWFGEASGKNLSAGDAPLEAGAQLLFRLRVPVSKLLGNALSELLCGEC